jgi:hypothetical protein
MIDMKKKYKTEGGYPVRIYATDGRQDYEVHGAYFVEGNWHPASWHWETGSHCGGTHRKRLHLKEVKKPHEVVETALNREGYAPSYLYIKTMIDALRDEGMLKDE